LTDLTPCGNVYDWSAIWAEEIAKENWYLSKNMDQLKFDKIQMGKVQQALENGHQQANAGQSTLTLDAVTRSDRGITLPGSAP
jgi:hypothetical protein